MRVYGTHLRSILLICIVVCCGWLTSPVAAQSIDPQPLRSTILRGTLTGQYETDFLAVEPLIRDGTVVLTLSYDPYDDPQLKGLISFYVLDQDGLRKYAAGGDVDEEEIAAGMPLDYDRIGNKMRASFNDSGRGLFTVVVFNNSTTPVDYTLSVIGGMLVDSSAQTTIPAEVAGDRLPSASRISTPTPTPDPLTNVGYAPVTARRVTGALDEIAKRHYLALDSDIRDEIISLKMTYRAGDAEEAKGKLNFWVLDDDGFRRLVSGDDPRELSLATGFPSALSEEDDELLASFRPSGFYNYNVIVFNEAGVPATYALEANGALLVDLFGQTNESRAAALEVAALSNAAVGLDESTAPSIGSAPAVLTSTSLTGRLTKAYEHHYFGLSSTVRDDVLVVTLDFEPKDSQALAENINFWVLDADGWRRVIAGARPEDHDIAMGAPIQYGPDRGKLRAVFNASGKGPYTVIVYNNSTTPARYSLSTQGGILEDASAQAEFLP